MPLFGGIIFATLVLLIADGFGEAFDWDAIQVTFAMAAMVPGASLVADRLLYPATRHRSENDHRFMLGFLALVTLLAFLVYQVGTSPVHRLENALVRYGVLWVCVFPHSCLIVVIADRVFDAFKGRHTRHAFKPFVRTRNIAPTPPQAPDNVIEFDPKRFR